MQKRLIYLNFCGRMIMFTKKCICIKGGSNMHQNEFSLQITSRDNCEKVTYEKCPVFCEHRSQILEKASQLGGTVGPTNSYIIVPTSEKLHELVRYIEELIFPKHTIVITVRGRHFAEIRKTSQMQAHRKDLLASLKTNHGEETEYGFSFTNPYDALVFIKEITVNYLFELF